MLWLWGVEYDNREKKAKLVFYDDKKHKMVKFTDPYGHKPFFYAEPNDSRQVAEIKSLLEEGEKLSWKKVKDLETQRYKKLLKITVNSPNRVKELRNKVRELGVRTYEDDIRYIRRYMMDTGLVPWMPYRVSFGIPMPAFESNDVFEVPVVVPKWIAFDIEVMPTEKSALPNPETDPVISVSTVASDGTKILFMLKEYAPKYLPRDMVKNGWTLRLFEDEKELIAELHKHLSKYPVVIGYNVEGFDIPYLVERAKALSLPKTAKLWTRRGVRIKAGEEFAEWEPIWGRLVDLFFVYTNDSIKAYTFGNAYASGKLEDVAQALLGEGKEFGGERKVWEMNPEELARYNAVDSELVAKLFMKNNYLIWKIIVLFARISGLGIDELWRTTISSWIEQMLNRVHAENDWLIPNKGNDKKGEKYQGAIVLEQKKGLYKNVYVFDFASLYPTNIYKWNLSYETVNPKFECENLKPIPNTDHKVCFSVPGVISTLIKDLREKRLVFKRKAKHGEGLTEEQREFYDAVQMSLKVFINASYGVLGNENFRYFKLPVAESVTALGRWALKTAIEIAEKEFGWKVIYGDSVTKDMKVIVKGCIGLKCYNAELVKIEELFKEVHYVDEKTGKEYYFPDGIEVLAYNTATGKTEFRKVKYVMRHKTNKKVYRIWITNQHYLDVSEDHSIIVWDPKEKKLKEVTPKELMKGKYYMLQVRKINEHDVKPKRFPEYYYELLGLFIGDGSINGFVSGKPYYFRFSLGNDLNELLPILDRAKRDGLIKNYNVKSKGDVVVWGTEISKLLSLAINERKKVIPSEILYETENNVNAFLRGLFTADGTVIKQKKRSLIRFTQIRDDITWTVWNLLLRSGVASRIIKERNPNYYKIENKVYGGKSYSYHLYVLSADIWKFKEKIGFLLERKNSRITISKIREPNKSFIDKDVILVLPKKIEEIPYDDYLYDIEVEGLHNFFANGFLVHNTDSLFISNMNKEISNEQIEAFIKKIEEELGYEIELDKVFDLLLLPGRKKLYIGRIKKPDGKTEIVLKGIKAKKSDAPEFIRETVAKLIEEMMKRNDITLMRKVAVEIVENAFSEIDKLPLEKIAFSFVYDKDISQYKSPSSKTAKVLTVYLLWRGKPPLPKERIEYVHLRTPIKIGIRQCKKGEIKRTGKNTFVACWKGEFVPVGDYKPAKTIETAWVPLGFVKEYGIEDLVDRNKVVDELRSAVEQIFVALDIPVPKPKKAKSLMEFLSMK